MAAPATEFQLREKTEHSPGPAANHRAIYAGHADGQNAHAGALRDFQDNFEENREQSADLLLQYKQNPDGLDHDERRNIVGDLHHAFNETEFANPAAREHVAEQLSNEIFEPLRRQAAAMEYRQAIGDPAAAGQPDAALQLQNIEIQQNRFKKTLAEGGESETGELELMLGSWNKAMESNPDYSQPADAAEYAEKITGAASEQLSARLESDHGDHQAAGNLHRHFQNELEQIYEIRQTTIETWKTASSGGGRAETAEGWRITDTWAGYNPASADSQDAWQLGWLQQDKELIAYNQELVERTAEGRGFLNPDLAADLKDIVDGSRNLTDGIELDEWIEKLDARIQEALNDPATTEFEKQHLAITRNLILDGKPENTEYALRADVPADEPTVEAVQGAPSDETTESAEAEKSDSSIIDNAMDIVNIASAADFAVDAAEFAVDHAPEAAATAAALL